MGFAIFRRPLTPVHLRDCGEGQTRARAGFIATMETEMRFWETRFCFHCYGNGNALLGNFRFHRDINNNINRGVSWRIAPQWKKLHINSHTVTSGARRGAFFRFSRPTLRRFSHLFVSDQFWRDAGAFGKTTIFFKLQAGVCPLCPPRLHRARTTPHHAPAPPPPHPI
jgi:hypothetical protein